MLCYADRTFCRGDGCQKFDTCPRALTPEVERKAKLAQLPVAYFANPYAQECYVAPVEPNTP